MGLWLNCKVFGCPSLFAGLPSRTGTESLIILSVLSLSRAVLSLSLANFLAASPGSLQTIKQQK